MSEPVAIRIIIADDHPLVREGLSTILRAFTDLELVGMACNGAEAIRLCAEKQPDVALLDLAMPDMDGATVTKAIRATFPAIQVIILTSFSQEEMIQNAIRMGAIGYLLKTVSARELADAIRAAKMGKPSFAPEVAQVLLHAAMQPPPPGHDLTARERDVLALLVQGCSNIEIAERLGVSPTTVKGHLNNIFGKLHVSNRTEAATFALQHHLVQRA